MDRLSVDDLETAAESFDAAVDATTAIDHVCSSSDWVLAGYRSWARDAEPLILGANEGYAALSTRTDVDGLEYLCPSDAIWGFGCPVVGADPKAISASVCEAVDAVDGWKVALLPGLTPDSRLEQALGAAFGQRHRLREGPVMTRCQGDLSDGLDAFLARRPSKWQRDVRRARRRAAERGIGVVAAPNNLQEAFDRLLAVERRSWKGRGGSGLIDDDLRRFYWQLAMRVGPAGRLRFLFAQLDGRDIGYVLGQVRGSTYRGLQISFDDSWRNASVGTLLQLAQLELLVADGTITYDLGMDMAYKRRWSDREFTTRTLAVIRR